MNTEFYIKLTESGYNYEGVRTWTKGRKLMDVKKIIVPPAPRAHNHTRPCMLRVARWADPPSVPIAPTCGGVRH